MLIPRFSACFHTPPVSLPSLPFLPFYLFLQPYATTPSTGDTHQAAKQPSDDAWFLSNSACSSHPQYPTALNRAKLLAFAFTNPRVVGLCFHLPSVRFGFTAPTVHHDTYDHPSLDFTYSRKRAALRAEALKRRRPNTSRPHSPARRTQYDACRWLLYLTTVPKLLCSACPTSESISLAGKEDAYVRWMAQSVRTCWLED
ncbi:hypothetical protein NMY22_g14091 [Coprinellus aureogranulatus]|nr:hypothetical protein NMY22_g14091 [Coprinellus aureogranulatus]